MDKDRIEFQPVDLLDPNKLVDIANTFYGMYQANLLDLIFSIKWKIKLSDDQTKLLNGFNMLKNRLIAVFPEIERNLDEIPGSDKLDKLEDQTAYEIVSIRCFLDGVGDLRDLLSK